MNSTINMPMPPSIAAATPINNPIVPAAPRIDGLIAASRTGSLAGKSAVNASRAYHP